MTGSHNDHLQLDCQLWRCICIGRIEKRKLFHFPFSFLFTYRLYFNVLLAHKHQRFPCVTEVFSCQVTMKPPRDIPRKYKDAMAIRCQLNNFHPTPREVQTSLVNRLTLVRLQKHIDYLLRCVTRQHF